MKQKLLLLALAFAAVAPLTARAETEVSFEFFYDNLSPYGDWVEVGDYGTCFRPRDVDADWSPYTDGYWSYTDAGWTWISYEDFGDITYHYGRWVRADEVGWCWVPDYEWGPAWVSWRKSDDYVGWAPLPPEARWRPSVGISVWADESYDIGPSYYNFCPVVDFGAPVIRAVCVPRVRLAFFFGNSVNCTNISYNSYSRSVFCGGPDFAYINRYSHRQVPALKLVQNTTIINNNVTIINNQRITRAPRNAVAGNTLQVFAPKVVNKNTTNIIKPQITQAVAKPKIDKGWGGVKDPGEMKKLRDKVKTDTKGLTPETAPARPVAVADLKPLPEKADTNAPSPVQVAPRPGKPGKDKPGKGNAISVLPAEVQPGTKPGGVQRPSVLPGEKPGKPATVETKPIETKPVQPSVMPSQQPGQAAAEPNGKPGKGDKKTGKPARPADLTPLDVPPQRPSTTTDNPLKKPFREPTTQPSPIETQPAMPSTTGKKQKGKDDNAERIGRQQQAEAAAGQQRMAEQAERQRAAAANAERMQKQQNEMRRQQVEPQRPEKPQMDLSEQRARQAEAAQRQATMQRQAEAQQRALQSQRQESFQRQMKTQKQQPYQPESRSVPQSRSQPQPMPRVQQQPRPQTGGGKGQPLTPEQIEALKKQGR